MLASDWRGRWRPPGAARQRPRVEELGCGRRQRPGGGGGRGGAVRPSRAPAAGVDCPRCLARQVPAGRTVRWQLRPRDRAALPPRPTRRGGPAWCEPAEPIRGPLTGQRETWGPARRKGPQTSSSLAMWGYCWNLLQRRKSSCNFHTVELFTSTDAISRSHTSRQVILSSVFLAFGGGKSPVKSLFSFRQP